MGSVSSSSGSQGNMGLFQQSDYEKFKDKVVTKCGIVITPLDKRQATSFVLTVLSAGLAAVSLFVAPPIGLGLATGGLFTSTGGLVAATKMYHFAIYLEIGQKHQIFISYNNKDLEIDHEIFYFLKDYRIARGSDRDHPCHDYNMIHKQKGLKNVIQIIQIKPNVLFSEVFKVMVSNKQKNYDLSDWNCKDYSNAIVNVLKQ